MTGREVRKDLNHAGSQAGESEELSTECNSNGAGERQERGSVKEVIYNE